MLHFALLICGNNFAEGDVIVIDHCHVTGKYRVAAFRDSNVKVKLNQKIPIVYRNVKHFNTHLIMQELERFNFKLNVIPTGLEKYLNFILNNTLVFVDSFQFLSS